MAFWKSEAVSPQRQSGGASRSLRRCLFTAVSSDAAPQIAVRRASTMELVATVQYFSRAVLKFQVNSEVKPQHKATMP